MEKITTAQIVIVGLDVVGRSLTDGFLFPRQELNLQLLNDGVSDLVLNREDVGRSRSKRSTQTWPPSWPLTN